MSQPTTIEAAQAEAYFPPKLRFLFKPARYKVAYGGRGSGKSWGFARALLIRAAEKPLRILCARELQISIRESVHELLKSQIGLLGLDGYYNVLQHEIRGVNGSEFIFSGLRSNVTKIKSMEAIDIVWVEEAETVSEDSWAVLIPTIRKPGSEIWVSFNPDQPTDPTYKRFVTSPPPDCVAAEVNWYDNPWFPEESKREKDYLYSVDSDAADHIWGGKTKMRSAAQVLNGKWIVAPFIPGDDWYGPYQGCDWGFAKDPSVLIRSWVTGKPRSLERELWIEYETYGLGVENDDLPTLFDKVPDARKYITRADNSRPETISDVRNHGYPKLQAASKWPGSVEDGIAHLRRYKRIVIHPRCQHTKEEARLYSYKTDRLTGDVLPDIIDKHNHTIDALRYSLDPLIRQAPDYSGFHPAPGITSIYDEPEPHWSTQV